MSSIRNVLQEQCCTEVVIDPPGITRISQPLDVAVVTAFKDHVRSYYVEYHVDNDFPKSPKDKRDLISRFVTAAWYSIP
ncbi:hypothetical protein PHPALM_28693 [Phytophthora palmivora]|uniref:DDE-1 domain-containing protein n=1 Tax=Phytophthora palmivora TaxID=4796 RepID=A0A2P4X9F0_9STRA|nr:hypothetical protein PHPALM_28693 [Phytophthora palmivora]